jgi:glycosyltransferase involved in cell wall biosynthesis
MDKLRITYFINQYPLISHAFIRREVLELERQGFDVQRIALRGWDAAIIDTEDLHEQNSTHYVLKEGLSPLLWATFRAAIVSPWRFARALALATRLGWRADRPLLYHLVYLAEACRIVPWMHSFGARHVHAHFGTNSTEIVMLAHVLGGPAFSFTAHGPTEFDMPQFLGIGEKVRRAAFVRAITSFCRSQLSRWVDHDHWSKIRVVHCGLESSFHQSPPTLAPAAPRLVCLGRLSEQKGQLLLIDAARRLVAMGVQFELILVGDGEMRAEIEALIDRHKLGNQVRLTGAISTERLREELLAARALVLPSFAEGLPMVIMEAMALRRPVLTTFVGGIPELVRPGETGWLFPAGSIDELVTTMQEVLSCPVEKLRSMGEAAYARVLERHAIDREVAKLAALFRECGAAAPSSP